MKEQLKSLEQAVANATGLKFEIDITHDSNDLREYCFRLHHRVQVPADIALENEQKQFTHLFSKARDGITEKIKQGNLWRGREEDHQREIKAFEAELEEAHQKIEELLKYKHHYDLEVQKTQGKTPDGKTKINS